MSTALPDGTRIADWGGFKLHDYLASWQDQNLGRVAQHTYDRRDGGENEDMGGASRVTKVTLLFEGSSGFDACRKFVALWQANKTRLLVHPLWGRYNATFLGIESGSLTVDQGANLYTVQGQFVESNINSATVADSAASVPTKAAAARAQMDAVNVAALDYAGVVATVAAVSSYLTTAGLFVDQVTAAASTGTPDPSLPSRLDRSQSKATASIAALRVAAADGPHAYGAIAACEVLAALLLDLGAAYLAQQPPLVEYVTSEAVPLLTIANRWYPGDARNRVSQILGNNPTLRGLIVPCGYRLSLASI